MGATITNRMGSAVLGRDGGWMLASLSVVSQAVAASMRTPVSASFCVDVSGSMDQPAGRADVGQWGSKGETKLSRAVAAVRAAAGLMGPDDEACLVAFSSKASVRLPMTRMDDAGRIALNRALDSLAAGGGTALYDGWRTAAEQAAPTVAAGRVSRVMLLTDGEATDGERNENTLASYAAGLAAAGVSTSCFGVGASFSEDLLMSMAASGAGNFFYIPDPLLTDEAMASEMDGAKSQLARNARVSVSCGDGAAVTFASGFKALADGSLDAGNLLAGRPCEILVRFDMPEGFSGDSSWIETRAEWTEADGTTGSAVERTVFSLGDEASGPDDEVEGARISWEAAKEKEKAAELARQGDWEGSMTALRGASFAMAAMPAGYSKLASELSDMEEAMALSDGGDANLLRKTLVSHVYSTSTSRRK